MYEIEKSAYTLNDAKAVQTEDGKSIKVLTVPMVLKTADGVEIIKNFTFKQGEYPVVVNHKVNHPVVKTGRVKCLVNSNVTTLMIQANRIKVFSRWALS